MIKIDVILDNINWKKYLKNPKDFIEKKVNLLNKKNKSLNKNFFLCSLLLSDDKKIKKLNWKFRKKKKSTDILSFPFYKKKDLTKTIKNKKQIYLGDIIINLDKIKEKNDNIKFQIEFDKLWLHGLLHLFGYKHLRNKDFKKMNNLEKRYFDYIN